jgi:hypothetical protein
MCSEVRFRRAIRGWLVGCATVTAVIYVLLVGFLASGPGGLSIHSIGAGIYLALVPPAIILVITCAVTGIPAAMVIWLSEKLGIVPVLWLCRWGDRHVEPGRRFSNAFQFHVVFRCGRILGRHWLLDSRRKARRSRRRLARRAGVALTSAVSRSPGSTDGSHRACGELEIRRARPPRRRCSPSPVESAVLAG